MHSNFGGNQRWRSRRYSPRSEEEVLAILERHRHEHIRALGSGYSWSAIGVCSEVTLDLRAFDSVQLVPQAGEPVVRVGPLAIDLPARIVTVNGSRVTLTPKEYRLLQLLAQHAGNVVTHQFLLKEVWGSPHLHDTHYLRIFVRKLRQKIEADPTQPRILLTELGVGYRLVVPEPAAAAG